MTDPFLEDCGGWTPAPDVLTRNKNYGFEGAYLWGRIRRLCQIGKGSYTISHEELGNRIGMSRRTVIKYLDRLIEDGYVEDLTPGVRNKAHTYSVKKGEAKIVSGMQILHTDIETTPPDDELDTDMGMRILHSEDAEIAHQDDPGMQELPSRYAKNAHPGMQNLHLNRESLETPLRDKDSSPYGEGGQPPIPESGQKLEQPQGEFQESPPDLNPPPETPPPESTKKRVRAPKPPAFQVYFEKTEYHAVTKEWVEKMVQIVGEKPEDLARWGDTITTFTGRGKWKGNVQDMLDWYQNGIPVYQNGVRNSGHQSRSQGHSSQHQTGQTQGLSETSTAISAALKGKSRGGRDPT